MSDINSIISNLKKINDEKTQSFILPCSGLEVTLKPFQAKHTSLVNGSLVAGGHDTTYTIKFTQLLKELFDDILTIEGVNTYNDIPLVDVHFLVLKIRKTFSDKVFYNLNEEGEGYVNIDDILSRYEHTEYCLTETVVDSSKKIKMVVSLPSFAKDLKFDIIIEQVKNRFSEKDKERLVKETLGYTILKFIDSIEINEGNETSAFEMKDLSPQDRLSILNHIPNDMYQDVMQSINKITKPLQNNLKIEEDVYIAMEQSIFLDARD